MVYADISSLYENGEHYDSLYGGASPGNVTPVVPIGPGDPPREDQDQDRPRLPMKKPLVPVSEDPEDPEDPEDLEAETRLDAAAVGPIGPGDQGLLRVS